MKNEEFAAAEGEMKIYIYRCYRFYSNYRLYSIYRTYSPKPPSPLSARCILPATVRSLFSAPLL